MLIKVDGKMQIDFLSQIIHTFLVVAVQIANAAAKEAFIQYLQQLQRGCVYLNAGAARHQKRYGNNWRIMVAWILSAKKTKKR